jgi:RNA polymerase sigma factor (sigma-70 family)
MNTVRQPTISVSKPAGLMAPWLSIVTTQQRRGAMPTSEELNGWANAVAQSADRQAFAALFKHFAPRVKAYLMASGTAEALAEDLTQEAMVTVWRKAALFDPARAGLSTWIFAIARNLRVDHFRRQDNLTVDGADHDSDEIVDPMPGLDEQVLAGEREASVRRALAQLSAEQANILRLSFFEERPHARIAHEMGIPLGTVKSRVRLAVHHLRRLLNGLEP